MLRYEYIYNRIFNLNSLNLDQQVSRVIRRVKRWKNGRGSEVVLIFLGKLIRLENVYKISFFIDYISPQIGAAFDLIGNKYYH